MSPNTSLGCSDSHSFYSAHALLSLCFLCLASTWNACRGGSRTGHWGELNCLFYVKTSLTLLFYIENTAFCRGHDPSAPLDPPLIANELLIGDRFSSV